VYRYGTGASLVNAAGLAAWVWILQLAVLLVAVLRLFRPRGVYLVLAVLCCAVSRFLVGLCCKPGRINKARPSAVTVHRRYTPKKQRRPLGSTEPREYNWGATWKKKQRLQSIQ
jgi:hypothetical protein